MMRRWAALALLGGLACERSDVTAKMQEQGQTLPAGLVTAGSQAPGFQATAHSGEQVKLSDFQGKIVVLYFYPKDDTPGCTIEAREFRDDWSDFQSADAVVLGVSADDDQSHVRFADKHQLPFLLLSDPDHEIAKAYGVPVRLGVTKRVTFVIDRNGQVAKVFDNVNPNGHAAEVLKVVTAVGQR